MRGKRIALVVGCNEFDSDAINNLDFTVNDAKAFHQRLVDPEIGNFDRENVHLLINPENHHFQKQLTSILKKANKNDTILFYYSGHGLLDEDVMYLAAKDTDIEYKQISALSANMIDEWLNTSRAGRICTILDCCHSGALGNQGKGGLDSKAIEKQLEHFSGKGKIIISSCQATQQAREKVDKQHGIFTYHMLQGMDGKADENQDGIITAEEVYRYVAEKMNEELGPTQLPTIKTNMTGGEFYLVVNGDLRVKAVRDVTEEVEGLITNDKLLFNQARAKIEEFEKQPGYSGEITALKESLLKQAEDVHLKYRSRLYNLVAERTITEGLLKEIIETIDQNSEKLFDGEEKIENNRWRIIRSHLTSEIADSALTKFWEHERKEFKEDGRPKDLQDKASGDGPDKKHDDVANKKDEHHNRNGAIKPGEDLGNTDTDGSESKETRGFLGRVKNKLVKSNLSWVLVFVATLGIVFAIAKYKNDEGVFDVTKLRPMVIVGQYDNATDVKKSYHFLFEAINQRLEKQGLDARIFTEDMTTVTLKGSKNNRNPLQPIIEQLKKGGIDLVGVASPRVTYVIRQALSAEPLVSPEYDDSPTYSSIIFVRRDFLDPQNTFDSANKTEAYYKTKTNTFRKVVMSVVGNTAGTDEQIALAYESSTSGYWYPRSEILSFLNAHSDLLVQEKEFVDMVVNYPHSDEIIEAVINQSAKVVAGATARFKFERYCGDNVNAPSYDGVCKDLVPITEIKGIPQGAFLAAGKLLEQKNVINIIKSEWGNAATMAREKCIFVHSESSKICKFITKNWRAIGNQHYATAGMHFNTADSKKSKKDDYYLSLLVVLVLIILAISLLYLVARTRQAAIANHD